jgi:hypothetical protein
MKLVVIFSIIVASASAAGAQDSLESARRAFADGALDVAFERFTDALENPTRDRNELAEIHRYLGVLRIAQGDVESGMREFEYSLAIDPNQSAPDELGSAHRARFDSIRGQRTGPIGLELSTDGAVSREAPTPIRAELVRAPAGLVVAVRIVSDSTGWQTELAPNTNTLNLPPAAWGERERVTLSASGVDSHGNVVVAATLELAPSSVISSPVELERTDPVVPEEEDDGGSVFESPIFWTIVGALVVGGAVTAVLFATATTEYQLTPRFEMP